MLVAYEKQINDIIKTSRAKPDFLPPFWILFVNAREDPGNEDGFTISRLALFKMATSKSCNTYNRQNWEDAVG